MAATAKGTLIGLTAPTPIEDAPTAASARDTLPPVDEPSSQAATTPGAHVGPAGAVTATGAGSSAGRTASSAQFASGERVKSGPVSEEDELPVCEAGQRFGDVVITRLVARGGMGEVYEAFHEHMEQRLALKVLRPRFRKRPDFVERFRDEGKLLAAFCQKEPNVVQIRNVAYDDRVGPYITMEWLVGSNFRELKAAWADAVPLAQTVALIITVADVTHRVHRLGLIHRDLKPENLFLERAPRVPDAEPRLVLLDLGIAKRAGGERTTDENRTLGTIEYMAPEQIQSGTATARSDQYAIGHMLHELLRGEHAFAQQMVAAIEDGGEQRRQLVVMAAHLFHDIEPLHSDIAPTVRLSDGSTLSLSAIAQRAMRREPAERYPSMEAFAADLRAWLGAYRGGGLARASSPALSGIGRLDDTPASLAEDAGAASGGGGLRTGASSEIATRRSPLQPGTAQTSPSPAAGLVGGLDLRAGDGSRPKPQPTLPALSMRSDLPHGAIESVAQTDFVAAYSLVVVSTKSGEAIARYPLLRAVIVVGRGTEECDVVLDDPTVSRLHCELRHVSPGVFQAVDLGSTHGVLLRGMPTKAGLLRTNDRLTLGHVDLRLCPPGCFRRLQSGGWSFVPSLFELAPEERATVRMIGNAAEPQGPVLDAEQVLARALPRTLHDSRLGDQSGASASAGPAARRGAARLGTGPSRPSSDSRSAAAGGPSALRSALFIFALTLLIGVGLLAVLRMSGIMPDSRLPAASAAAPPPASPPAAAPAPVRTEGAP